MTMDIPTYEQLELWAKEMGMKTRAELIRTILRKKEKIQKILYSLAFWTPNPLFS